MQGNTELAKFQKESKARIAVLQKLGFVDKEGIVTMKGRAACEIDTTDELLSTGERAEQHRADTHDQATPARACRTLVWPEK